MQVVGTSGIVFRSIVELLTARLRAACSVCGDDDADRESVETLWLRDVVAPVLAWIPLGSRRHPGVRVLGISGGPGAGKSSLAAAFCRCLDRLGRSVTCLAFEDYYLSADRREAAGLRWRAVPGSHDTARLRSDVHKLLFGRGEVQLPQFDMRSGAHSAPRIVPAPVDVIVLEGLFLGSNQVDATYTRIAQTLDFHVHLAARMELLKKWRFERESGYRASSPGRVTGMELDELSRFWDEALQPTTERYTVPLASSCDICVELGSDHRVINAVARSLGNKCIDWTAFTVKPR